MKNFWIAVQEQWDDKWYAHAIRVSECDNLCAKLRNEHIVAASICPTKKFATQIVTEWNNMFIANGEYMFSDGPSF